MNCNDAREGFSRGGMGLTERALVHAHVMQCMRCQQERESLPLAVSSRRRVAPSRPARLRRLRALGSVSLILTGQAAVRAFETGRVGVTRVPDLLPRVRGLRWVPEQLSERVAAYVIRAIRSGMTNSVKLLTRLGVLLSLSSTVFGHAMVTVFKGVGVGVTRVADLLNRVRGPVSLLVKRSERAAANVIGAARFGITSLTVFGQAVVRVVEVGRAGAPLIGRVRLAMTRLAQLAFQRSARVASEAGRAGIARAFPLLTRVRGLPPLFFARFERVAVQAIGVTWAAGRVIVTPPSRVRPRLKVCAGIASLAVLLAALLPSWPRPWWPGDLPARFSTVERLSPDVRQPVDRTPLEPVVAAPLVQTSAPKPVSARRPAAPAAIPAPSRRPDPSLARSQAPDFASEPADRTPLEPVAAAPLVQTSAPRPVAQTEVPAPSRRPDPSLARQTAEASDSTATIDWLLSGGSGRRRIENP